MNAHPAKLLICGYVGAVALAVAALPVGTGFGQIALAVWLFGPLLVIGLAMMPGVRRAFSADERFAPQTERQDDQSWIAAEEELRKWDSDLHADIVSGPDRSTANDRRLTGS